MQELQKNMISRPFLIGFVTFLLCIAVLFSTFQNNNYSSTSPISKQIPQQQNPTKTPTCKIIKRIPRNQKVDENKNEDTSFCHLT
jgi:hypothetical protein